MGRLIVPLLLATLLAAGPARAQGEAPREADDQRARVLYENGAILYEEGRYEDAVVAWKEGYELSNRPLFLFNIANALERIGRWEEALEYLNQYRAFAPSEERTVLERRMRNIERRLEESGQGTPPVEETSGAREDASTPVAPVAKTTAGTLGPGAGLIGGGAAVLGLGAGLAVVAVSARSEAETLCKDSTAGLLCPADAAPFLERDAGFSLASDVVFGVGAGMAVVGVALTVAHLASGDKNVAFVPTPGPTGLGFGVAGRLP